MNLARLFMRRNPARTLAMLGVEKRKRDRLIAHERVLAVARDMRRDAGMPPSEVFA